MLRIEVSRGQVTEDTVDHGEETAIFSNFNGEPWGV